MPLAQLRILAATLMGALVVVVIGIAAVVAGDEDAWHTPDTVLVGGLLALGVVLHLLVEAVGYRLQPIPAGTPSDEVPRMAQLRFQAAMILRFALCESVGIISVAMAFVVAPGGFILTLIGCATSLVLMAVHVWPGDRPVRKSLDALEREGAVTGLRTA